MDLDGFFVNYYAYLISLYYLTCRNSPSMLISFMKQVLPRNYSIGRTVLFDRYSIKVSYGTRS